MEELSMFSNNSTNLSGEASDANSCSYPGHTKRLRYDSTVCTTKFKGVVHQQNGHWGAQIYANHQRIWLGTFKSEKEAAMAYDSAAIRLRNGNSHRNFPWTNSTVQEPNFQSQFSTEVVLNMIKDGSYTSKFTDYLRMLDQRGKIKADNNFVPMHSSGAYLCTQLFQKELTPSDVGRLNRLVIPKKFALKYFPCISDGAEQNAADGGLGHAQLIFFDMSMRSWKFRYCYWKSSESFVFTRGWNRFVKEKQLKEKDMLVFSAFESRDESNRVQIVHIIDVHYHDGERNKGGVAEDIKEDADILQLDSKENIVHGGEDEDEEFEGGQPEPDPRQNIDGIRGEKESKKEKELVGIDTTNAEKKGFMLFGVQIF